MILLAFILLALSNICYVISQLNLHGKLRWSNQKKPYNFFGEKSHIRKYKWHDGDPEVRIRAPKNLYYKLIGSDYVEKWFTSTWLTVNFTDVYHLTQSMSYIFLSLGVSILSGVSFIWIWPGLLIVNFLSYKILER